MSADKWAEMIWSVNWMEWAKVFFDLLKGIAWPFSVMFIVWLFRFELRDRIKDIVSVGPTGVGLQPPSQQVQPKPPTGVGKPATHPLQTVQTLIKTIEAQIVDMPEDERLPKLVSLLAEAQIERGFEFIWGSIFGSQVTALRRIREAGSLSSEELKRFYDDEVKNVAKFAFEDLPFESWFAFLTMQQLVVSTDLHRYALTDYGRDFLAFVDLRKQGAVRAL